MKIRVNHQNQCGVALIITLSVLVLVSIIVVAYATLTRFESSTARQEFDAERAKLLAGKAVDDVTAKLRDNIPASSLPSRTDYLWAAAPGRLYVNKSLQDGNPVTVNLYSEDVNGVGTGKVALNAPILGASSKFPIIPQNSEYAKPNPMQVDWINVLQDGTTSLELAYAPSAANPIIGRYAYWVDTESSKVNINTAGKAMTSYTTSSVLAQVPGKDIQNLTAHPSRVDLSQLDSAAGAITPANSIDTYNFTDSSLWYGGVGTENQMDALKTDPTPRASLPAPPGMRRFNSISEWTRIAGVDAAKVDANKFYLTTQGRTPELNPWGLNKSWWQASGGPQVPKIQNDPALPGNVLNIPSKLPYPPKAGVLGDYLSPHYSGKFAESRYYAYPAVVGQTPKNMQNFGWLTRGPNISQPTFNAALQSYMENMMALLNRNDWPGMPAVSFVDKYGQEECETLAINALSLFESSAGNFGTAAGHAQYGPITMYPTSGKDDYGAYGSRQMNYKRPDGTSRYLSGIGMWPYMNEVAVKFRQTPDTWPPATPGKPATLGPPPTPGHPQPQAGSLRT